MLPLPVFATREATDLGANDFNAYLERLGVEWRLQTVVEDSTSQPVIADEKVKALFAQQIDIVIGPRTLRRSKAGKAVCGPQQHDDHKLLFNCS